MVLSEVTKNIEGFLLRDGTFQTLEYCTGKLEVPFLTFMGNEKFMDKISPYASCVLCSAELADKLPNSMGGGYLYAAFPRKVFSEFTIL